MATTYHAGRRIWTRQPNRVLQVATGPSNTAPALAWNAAVPWVNQATGKAMQAMNGARQRAGVPGIGIRFASSTNAGIKVDGPNLLKGSAGNWSAGLTVYLLADPPANTTRSLPFAFSDNATQPQSYFGFNVDLSLAASSGRWSVTDGAAGSYASGVLDGNPHVFCAVFGGSPTGPSLYVDGKLRNTAGNSIGDYAGAGQDIWIGGYSSGSWAASDYSVYGVFAFNESHTTDQVARVSASFWQQYEPERIWVPVSVAGSGAAALEGAATGAASAAGAITTSIQVASAAVVSGSAAGSLSTAIQFAGAAQASGQATGALTTGIPLAGVVVSATLAAGDLTTQIRLDGAALAAALASGTLAGGAAQLAGGATVAAQAAGGLTTVIVLQGAAVGAALAAGDLTAPGSGLAGAATGGAVAAGALTTQIPLAGGATVSVIAAGDVTTTVSLAGAAVGVVSATGDLVIALALDGAAVAAALAGASLSTAITMRGDAVAGAQAAGQLLDPVPVYAAFGVRKALTRVQQYGRRTQMQSSRRRN